MVTPCKGFCCNAWCGSNALCFCSPLKMIRPKNEKVNSGDIPNSTQSISLYFVLGPDRSPGTKPQIQATNHSAPPVLLCGLMAPIGGPTAQSGMTKTREAPNHQSNPPPPVLLRLSNCEAAALWNLEFCEQFCETLPQGHPGSPHGPRGTLWN